MAGDRIFSEGDAPDVAYLIESGQVEVWIQQEQGRVVLSHLGPGEILGEMAVIDRAPRSATADAMTAVTAIEIRADQLRARLDEADPVLRGLVVGLLSRYRRGLHIARYGSEESQPPEANAAIDQRRRVADKIRLERELLEALERQQLRVLFQPIFDLHTRTVAGFEALVRWKHPTLGEVAPAEFIALAEETSLIVPIGHYALRSACRLLAKLDQSLAGAAAPWIAVNVSGRQSLVPDFADTVAASAQEVGLSPRRLKVEITESLALNYERVIEFIDRCRFHGIEVALDDFGTGYSGLAHLQELRFDSIKLDKSFVSNLTGDIKSAALVRGIAFLVHGLGADMVAEGVENLMQARALKALGVRYLQGYLIGHPQDAMGTLDMLLRPPVFDL